MKDESKLYEQGAEEYPKSQILLGNLVMILWIGLGTAACWFLYPLAGRVYLVVAVTLVFLVLRWLVCTNCYYYGKWCPIGWGKRASPHDRIPGRFGTENSPPPLEKGERFARGQPGGGAPSGRPDGSPEGYCD